MLLNVFVVYSFLLLCSLLSYEHIMITHSLVDRHWDSFQYQLL